MHIVKYTSLHINIRNILQSHIGNKKQSHISSPVLVSKPVKVNPMGLAGREEEISFQKVLSESS